MSLGATWSSLHARLEYAKASATDESFSFRRQGFGGRAAPPAPAGLFGPPQGRESPARTASKSVAKSTSINGSVTW